MVSWRAACHAQRSVPSKAAPPPAAAPTAAAPAPALASSLLRFVESSTSISGAGGGAPALPGAAAIGSAAGDAPGVLSRSGGAESGAGGSLASSKSSGSGSSSSGDVRSDLLRQMAGCLEEPAHPLRRAGVELLTHALGTALRHTVDEAAAGASLQVTLGLRDAAARLCRCCAVGLDALLAASLPASTAAFGGPAAAGAAGAAERGQQAATVADSEAVLLSLYPVRLRQLLLYVYEGAVAPPRRPGAGPSASAAGAGGAGGSGEAATGPEAAPALAAAAVLARVCRGLVPQLKRYAMTSLSAAGAAFTAGASAQSSSSSSSSSTFASSSTSPWAAVSELPAVDAELARHVVDHVMRAFEAARPILLPAPLLMVT
jgi:hypothetical protein